MISSITIKGFRGIESGQMCKLTQFNVLVGANNAGKSAVLEALYLASSVNQTVELVTRQKNAIATYEVQIPEQDLLGNPPLKLIASKHSDMVESSALGWVEAGSIRVEVADRTAPEPLQSFELDISGIKSAIVKTDSIALFAVDSARSAPEGQNLTQILLGDVEPLLDISRTIFCWHPDLTYYTKGSAIWMIEGQPPVAQHTLFCDSSVLQSDIPLPFYRHALNAVSGWIYRIAQHLATIYELDAEPIISFLPRQGDGQKLQAWLGRKDRPALQIDAFGDGARAAFKLLAPLIVMAELATPEAPGLLLWEEPESFQNPKTLGRLLAEVVNIIRDKPIQVFIATHNLEFVAYVTQMLQSNDLKPEETMLFHMSLASGQLKSSWFDRDTLITWLDSGIDPRAWKDFIPPLQFHLQEKHP